MSESDTPDWIEPKSRARDGMLELVRMFASGETAMQLTIGPINKFVDARELYAMYYDQREMLVLRTEDLSKTFSKIEISAIVAFEDMLEEIIPDEPGMITDAELVQTHAWTELQRAAHYCVLILTG